MKRKLLGLVAAMAIGASLASGVKAQDVVNIPESQSIVNRRINEQVIDRAIIHQATHGRKHSSKGRVTHKVTRHIRRKKSK